MYYLDLVLDVYLSPLCSEINYLVSSLDLHFAPTVISSFWMHILRGLCAILVPFPPFVVTHS